ncbi:MAG: phage/plasmid primase, P4 family [Pseudomonadota bacterium]|nr:phage/plasmid primase, P4 family [Pseudomonadota bacterium]
MQVTARLVSAVLKLAAADPRIAKRPEDFDRDPWLFNTWTGTVELKTGEIREHRREDYITKWAPVGPGGDCPLFLEFLNQIFDGDAELISYLQKYFGYILTGVTTEHSMLFFYGTGANGKSVLLSTIAGVMGKYHKVAPMDSFTSGGFAQHPTDMAGLQGARLVTAIETEEGRTWAEAKIKSLTGGDKITARFMRQDFFEYVPVFKLIVVGNHKPNLRSVDEAMRRRLNLIPFNVTISPGKRDKNLVENLKAEWPGILQWMIEGCLKWQREGLNPPAAVAAATADYFGAEDSIGTWIEERCELSKSYTDTSAALFSSWKAWAELTGEPAINRKAFANKLACREGIEPYRTEKGRGYKGIRVVNVDSAFMDRSPSWHDA